MCKECQCQSDCKEQCIIFAIDIPQPYQCVCSPDPKQVSVETTDVVAGLLKYNSNLTKYLSKYQTNPKQYQPDKTQAIIEVQGNPQIRNTHKSIIDIYNLKVGPPQQQFPTDKQEDNKKQKDQQSKRNNRVDFQQQTSPRNQYENGKKNKDKIPKPPKGSNEQKLQKHMKQVADSSRYLSNTGFKKYFGRQCFENYGRQNTNGVADGIVYNGYLKTFNISPHCGTNMPLTEQTNKHTLVKGDPNKYDKTKPIPQTHYGNKADRQQKQGYHKKPLANMPQIIEQSQKYHQNQQKYNINITQPPRHQSERYAKTVSQVCKKLVPPPPPPFIPPSRANKNKRINQNKYQSQAKTTTQINQPIRRQNKNQIQQIKPQSTRRVQINNQYQTNNKQQNSRQAKYEQRRAQQPDRSQQQTSKREYQEWQSDDDLRMQHRMRQKKNLVDQCYYNIHLAHELEKGQKPPCGLCANRRYTKCCCGG